uniref:ribonuclease H n=1 Tax=Neolamprologus brichardi TaxID=32507 RepID=A0A3Q4I4B9_NEOBR
MEKHREKNKMVHMVLLDLEKAFNRVPHKLIWRSLRTHGVPEAYVKWTQLLYRNVTSEVRCSAGTSPAFPITVGVHQGSALSPLLFTLCMDTATADLQSPHPWSLLYADDMCLSETENCLALQTQTQAWKDRLSENGMRLNIKKTEYLECGPQTNSTITIDGEPLTKVAQFKYLGSLVTTDCDQTPDSVSKQHGGSGIR